MAPKWTLPPTSPALVPTAAALAGLIALAGCGEKDGDSAGTLVGTAGTYDTSETPPGTIAPTDTGTETPPGTQGTTETGGSGTTGTTTETGGSGYIGTPASSP